MPTFMRPRVLVTLVGLATLAASSCAKGTAGAPTSSSANGDVTSADPAAPSTTPQATTARTPTAVAPLPGGTSPQADPTPSPQPVSPESTSPPPSPAVLEAVSATTAKLGAVTAGLDGAKVRFVDCAATASCTARLEAPSLTTLRDLLQAVSAQQGGIDFVAREQLDGFAGRSFTADVTLGGSRARPVPTDENELLGGSGDGT